jgi:hypothetical protein
VRDFDPAYDRLGSDSVIRRCLLDVRFGSLFGLRSDISRGPSCANSRHMQRSKLQFYSITSSAHFPVSNTSASLGPQMTKWLSLGSRCAARHPTSVVTCFFFARLLWTIGAQ